MQDGNTRYQQWTTDGDWRPLKTPQWGHPNLNDDRRKSLRTGQEPFALVVCCSDSRVPPELVFDQGLGDLFVVRTAGHVIDDAAAESIAYGIGHLKIKLLVVLGHKTCGAVNETVKAFRENRTQPPASALLRYIWPAVRWAAAMGHEKDLLEMSVQMNVRNSMAAVLRIREVADAVGEGRLEIVPMEYDLVGDETRTPDPIGTVVTLPGYISGVQKQFIGWNNNNSWYSVYDDLAQVVNRFGGAKLSKLEIRCGSVIDSVQMYITPNGEPERVFGRWGGDGGGQHFIHADQIERIRSIKVWGGKNGYHDPVIGKLEFTLDDDSVLSYGTWVDLGLQGEWQLVPGEHPLGFGGRWGSFVDGLALITAYSADAIA